MPPEPVNSKTQPAPDNALAELGAELAKLLGLPADASPKELIAKLAARLVKAPEEPDPAKYMPVAAVQEMLQDRRAAHSALAGGRAAEKVRVALQQGYITNGMKDWALALCQTDEGSFDNFLATTGPSFAYLSKSAGIEGLPPGQSHRAAESESETEAAICAQLGLKPGTLASS